VSSCKTSISAKNAQNSENMPTSDANFLITDSQGNLNIQPVSSIDDKFGTGISTANTVKDYVDGKIGTIINQTVKEYVDEKIGTIGNETVKEYVDDLNQTQDNRLNAIESKTNIFTPGYKSGSDGHKVLKIDLGGKDLQGNDNSIFLKKQFNESGKWHFWSKSGGKFSF
jgi:hypothetical protein